MVLILIYVALLVKFVPLRYYYKHYLEGHTNQQLNYMQLFGDQIRQYRRVMQLFPGKITCLMESMAFHIYFKQQGVQVPIFIGLKTGENMEAHAWNFCNYTLDYSVINKQ